MQTFVPKNRRPKFDLFIEIHDLNNVPLVSGQAYVKWHLQGSTRADSRGRTTKETIKDHKVAWHSSHACQNVRMTIGRNGMLQEQLIFFEVSQEYANARERIALGTVQLNLAEYTRVQSETRRYLMQDSKINSTLKVTISLTQVGGDDDFLAPPLRSAQVFGGIAGIIGESRDQEDSRTMISTAQKRDKSAIHDMYRCTLAASWQLQAGELNPEECIEDIFSGGDGWTPRSERSRRGNTKPKSVRYEEDTRRKDNSDSDSLSAVSSGGGGSTGGIAVVGGGLAGGVPGAGAGGLMGNPRMQRRDGDAVSIVSFATMPKSSPRSIVGWKTEREVDEMRAREDLVSWKMPSVAR